MRKNSRFVSGLAQKSAGKDQRSNEEDVKERRVDATVDGSGMEAVETFGVCEGGNEKKNEGGARFLIERGFCKNCGD